MLIIAIPKSATTSLIVTLAEITGLKISQGVAKVGVDIDCEGFKELQKYHSNMIERSGLFLKQVITGRKRIFKEHLLPTKRHLKYLEKYRAPIAIFLRDPDHVYDAYKRHDKLHFRKFNKHIDLDQIEKDIIKFHDVYLKWSTGRKNVKIIYFKDLILSYKKTIKAILKHYGLNVPKNITPLKEKKYTGIGKKRLMQERKNAVISEPIIHKEPENDSDNSKDTTL